MLSLLLLSLLRTPALTILRLIKRDGSKYYLLLLLKGPHLVLTLAMLTALGMRLSVNLFPVLTYLFANEFFDEGEGGVLEGMLFDECFDLVLDVVHIIDIAEPYLTGLALFADVYLDYQLLSSSFLLDGFWVVLRVGIRGVHLVLILF